MLHPLEILVHLGQDLRTRGQKPFGRSAKPPSSRRAIAEARFLHQYFS